MTADAKKRDMAGRSLAQRLVALDQPDQRSEAEAIWFSVRPVMLLLRVLLVVAVILIGEIFDDLRIQGLSIGVWALIAGIPLFLLVSMLIVYLDQKTGMNQEKPEPPA
ncbi:MAG: hypothetical protein ACPGMW_00845 [Poseidonia sp.]|jgi:uncharacterized membrane protein